MKMAKNVILDAFAILGLQKGNKIAIKNLGCKTYTLTASGLRNSKGLIDRSVTTAVLAGEMHWNILLNVPKLKIIDFTRSVNKASFADYQPSHALMVFTNSDSKSRKNTIKENCQLLKKLEAVQILYPDFPWLAANKDGEANLFDVKPQKTEKKWISFGYGCYAVGKCFPGISWSDMEPIYIPDAIKMLREVLKE